jgi:N-methylhydantoinase B
VNKYGLYLVNEVIDDLLDYSEKLTRNEISLIKDGRYEHEEKLLDDGFQGGPYTLKLTVIVEGDNITFDYTGTDKQIRGPINSPLSATISATYYTMRCITNAHIPTNQGCHRPIKVVAPEGTLVNCTMPIGCFQRWVPWLKQYQIRLWLILVETIMISVPELTWKHIREAVK